MKRLCADDSAGSRVKVGHCQAIKREGPGSIEPGPFSVYGLRQYVMKVAHKATFPRAL